MKHEEIIKREDGSRVLVEVSAWINNYSGGGMMYNISVATKAPRKRTWIYQDFGDDYDFRRLSMEDREEFLSAKQLEIVTKEEIYQAKLKLWEKMKPKEGEK